MAYLIFGGDMLVTAFMVALVVWISVRQNDDRIAAAARIPLEDEVHDD
jgi:cbb3-type cytochrome oxidase subunit 3